jgi:ribonuclease Z
MQLRKFGHNPGRIHHIFISHLHGDHVFGLFGLLSTLGMMGRSLPLNLYGPENLKEMMEHHFAFFGRLPFALQFHSPDPSGEVFIYEDEKLTVTPLALSHRTMTYGYLFREKKRLLNLRKDRIEAFGLGIADMVKVRQGADYMSAGGKLIPNSELTFPPYRQRSYAYISDTVFDPQLAGRIRDVDLLFHEATFSDKDEKLAKQTLHSTSRQAAEIARKAGVKKLLIGHFSSRYKDHGPLVEEARLVFSATDGVNDGDVYSVPLERVPTE